MKLSEYVLEASAQQYEAEFARHPLFATLAQGGIRRPAYLAYLRETYHLIRHTTAVMARAASHMSDEARALKAWFLEQALDEHNHDLLCLNDIKALGEEPLDVVSATPKRGAWGLITQGYYLAEHDPVALLGYFFTTEGIGASYATTYSNLLTSELYGYKPNQVTFLSAHGGFDVQHEKDLRTMIDGIAVDSRSRDAMLAVRRFSITYYAQMLRDAFEENTA